jgi:hypothetical protein
MLREVNDAAALPSAGVVGPGSTGSEPKRRETSRRDAALVGLAVASYTLAVGLAYLVLATPQVRRLSWALTAACVASAVLAVVLARSRGARALIVRWAAPIVAFVVGWGCVGAVVTWSFPASITGWFILALLVVADVFLVAFSLIAVARDWKVGVLGLLVIGLMWIPIFVGPSESTVRRLRVELAAPSLVEEARRVLDDPSKAKDMGPFIAYDESQGRVVGWLIGPGLLGRGPGLVWDPEGVLRPRGSAHTLEGYRWDISGYACEPIVDDWLYCDLR